MKALRQDGALLGFALLGGTLLIALGARIDVPMVPVPMSLQSYAVVLVGALAGWRLGGAIVLSYLTCGALGAPVFAGGGSGVRHLFGPTAGYLFGFLLAAMLVGATVARTRAARGWTASLVRSTVAMMIGHGVILGLGALVLGLQVDWVTAYESGFRPFLLGGLAKSIFAAATVLLVSKIQSR